MDHKLNNLILKYLELLPKYYQEHSDAQKKNSGLRYPEYYPIIVKRYRNEPYFFEESILYLAIIRNDLKKLSQFLYDFTNINILSRNGKNAICYAVEYADLNIIEKLLDHGCNIVNPRGMKENPIKIAYDLEKFDKVDYLLDKLNDLPSYHFELLEKTFANDKVRLSKLKQISILVLP